MLAESLWQSIFQMPQISVIMGCLIPIAGIVGGYWYSAQKMRSEHELKKTMIERGLSAAEIERIMAAGRDEESET